MSQPITLTNLRRAVRRHVDTLAAFGLIPADVDAFTFQEGSKAYGNAFQLNTLRNGGTGHYRTVVGDDYLGMTKAEAYENITTRTRAIIDTMWAIGRGIDADWDAGASVVVYGIGEKVVR